MEQRRTTVLPEQISVCPDEEYEVLLLDEKFPKSARTFSGLLGSKKNSICVCIYFLVEVRIIFCYRKENEDPTHCQR